MERVHFYMVSARIARQTGRKIKDNYEKQKMQKFVQELEQKYELSKKQTKEQPDFKFLPRSRNIKQNLENLFAHLNRMQEITSKEMYSEVLKLFNVEIKKSGRGHIVLVTDGEGNPIRYPIRLSKFKEQPKFYQKVEENIRREKGENKAEITKEKPYIQLSKSIVRSLVKLVSQNNADRDFKKQQQKKRKRGKQKRF